MSACNCHLISFFLVLLLTLDQGPLTTSTTKLPCSINWFLISLNLATRIYYHLQMVQMMFIMFMGNTISCSCSSFNQPIILDLLASSVSFSSGQLLHLWSLDSSIYCFAHENDHSLRQRAFLSHFQQG